MNDFVFQSPTRFVFGRDVVDQTGAEVATAGIAVLAKRPDAVGKAVISASFVELYAILALLISLLLILL